MGARWFLFTVAAGLLMACLAVVATNVMIDSYGLYPSVHLDRLDRQTRYLNNDRYGKIQEFESGRFDGVLLGGSRAAFLNTADLEAQLGGTFYNFGMSSLGIGELQSYVERILSSDSVKTLVICLNFYTFSANDEENQNFDKEVVEGTLNGRIRQFLVLNLSMSALEASYKVIERTFWLPSTKERAVQSIDPKGNRIHSPQSQSVRKKGWQTVTENFRKRYHEFDLDPRGLETVAEIVRFASERGTKVVFYVPPTSTDLMDLIQAECAQEFAQWKTSLAKITAYYDFSGYNSVTKDPQNFYDPSHAKVEIGRWIFSRMFGKGVETVPEDFGRLVARVEETAP